MGRFFLCANDQGNEVYGGGDESVGIFLHRSGDDAIVKGEQLKLKERACFYTSTALGGGPIQTSIRYVLFTRNEAIRNK